MIFLFDVGGVVANSSSMQNICIKLGIDKLTFKSLQKDSNGFSMYAKLLTGAITTEYYWRNFSNNYGREILEDYFTSCYKPIANIPLIEKIGLLRNKYRVICGTNTIASHYSVHNWLGTYDIFDCVYSSHFLGVKKPDIEFFKVIIKQEKINADEIIFIDDCQANIDTAISIGINANLFENNEKIFKLLDTYL